MSIYTDQIRWIELDQHNDNRGSMAVGEGLKNIPFEIRRVFINYDTDAEAIRGCHANKTSKFVMICLSGSVSIKIRDRDYEEVFILDHPAKGLYLPEMTWKEMYGFSNGAVLLVLSSEYYDGTEYIRDYDQFIKDGGPI